MRRFSKFSVMCATLLAALVLVCTPARTFAQHSVKGQVLTDVVPIADVHERVADLGYFMIQSEESHLKIGWDGSDDTLPEVFDADTFEDLFSFVVREESKISINIFSPEAGEMLVVTFVINSAEELVVTVSTDEGYNAERWTIPSGEGAEALLAVAAKCKCFGTGAAGVCGHTKCDNGDSCTPPGSSGTRACRWTYRAPSPVEE